MNKDPVIITATAKQYITEILKNNPNKHLRIGVNNKGCSGHKYTYDLCDWDQYGKFDEVVEWDTSRVVIDGASILSLIGSILDLKTTEFESQLIWSNPLAINTCGCGESFQLATDLKK